MRLLADVGRCAGAGQCVLAAPALFDQDEEEGTVVLLAARVAGADAEAARRAVMRCPSGAISLSPD